MDWKTSRQKKKAMTGYDSKKKSMTSYDSKNTTSTKYIPPYRVRTYHKGKYVYYKQPFIRMPSNWGFFKELVDKCGSGTYQILNKKSQLVTTITVNIPKVQLSKVKVMEKRIAELEEELEGKEQRDYTFQQRLKLAAVCAYQGKEHECANIIKELFPKQS